MKVIEIKYSEEDQANMIETILFSSMITTKQASWRGSLPYSQVGYNNGVTRDGCWRLVPPFSVLWLSKSISLKCYSH